MKKLAIAASRHIPPALFTPQACRWAALSFFVLMLLAGAIPGKAEALSAVVYDKLLHFVAYSFLTALIYGATNAAPQMRAWLAVTVIGLLGALDEGVQALLPYRHGSWLDWQIDLAAAIMTAAFLFSLRLPDDRYPKRNKDR